MSMQDQAVGPCTIYVEENLHHNVRFNNPKGIFEYRYFPACLDDNEEAGNDGGNAKVDNLVFFSSTTTVEHEWREICGGLIFCDILCPGDIFLPVLGVKNPTTKKLTFASCRTCMTEQRQTLCVHSEEQRIFREVFTLEEVAYAVAEVGYTIKKVSFIFFFEFLQAFDTIFRVDKRSRLRFFVI